MESLLSTRAHEQRYSLGLSAFPVITNGADGEYEGEEIVVTAKFLPMPSDNSGYASPQFNLADFFYLKDYGPGTARPDPFGAELIPVSLSASEIVSRTCEAIAEAIKTVTNLARPVLPRSEEIKLDALSDALEHTATALKAGALDMSTARTQVQSSLAVAFDVLSGAGMGLVFAGLGAFATTLTPSPVLKALGTAGFGAIGIAADWMLSDTGAANQLASIMTDALFDGAQAFSDKINEIITNIYHGIDVITHSYMPTHDISYLDLQSDGTFGDGDGQLSNGSELQVAIYHNGLNENYLFTTNDEVVIPSYWPGYNGPGPKTPPSLDPPLTSMPAPIDEIDAVSMQSSLLNVPIMLMETILPA